MEKESKLNLEAYQEEKKIGELVPGYAELGRGKAQDKASLIKTWMETASEEDKNKFFAILYPSMGGRRGRKSRRRGLKSRRGSRRA
jgi:hypothetical protein